MKIQPIVEGYGELDALPVLLRRLCAEAHAWDVEIGSPFRYPRNKLVKEEHLTRAVQVARYQPGCEAIIIVFDGDKDCPAEFGPQVLAWAKRASGDTPCEVVLAHREYEAWFLAAIESLRTHKLVRPDAETHPHPERPRGAKADLRERLVDANYSETAHQAAFSALFCLSLAYRRSRSFRKLTSSFGTLLKQMGKELHTWPPEHWAETCANT